MRCNNCKSEILATAKFCPECGNKVENKGKTCTNKDCNRTGLPLEAIYCPDCGTKLFESEIVVSQNSNPNVFSSQSGFGLVGNLLLDRPPIINKVSIDNSKYSFDISSPYKISEECIACGTCIDECPVEAISEGDVYVIDADLCCECGSCAEVCPVEAISQ
jgi:Pyruvate/2-oxoacid:ferredoxin oxidoreductase delta subunit